MSLRLRLPTFDRARARQVIALPLLAGALLAAVLDPSGLPLVGREKYTAVLLLDGQAYFGRITDVPWSDTVELRDVYYFQDARGTTTNLSLGLVRRGSEVHLPSDGMAIRRDKVLAIETLRADSAVLTAILTNRAVQAATTR